MTVKTPTTTPPATKPRVAFWDNAKWLAMALVVIGHIVQPLAHDSDAGLSTYLLIYAFHMPLFGLISGYFTTDAPTPRHYARVVTDLVVPYLLFELIWSLIRSIVNGRLSFDPTTASWTLWFLLSLAAFRLVLPVLARLRWPLLWVTLLAVAVGYWDGVDQTLSAMRTIQMLPFFVLGWQLKRWGLMDRWMEARSTLPVRIGAIAAFVAVAIALFAAPQVWRDMQLRRWFFMDRAFGDITGDPTWYDGGIRLAIIAVTVLLVASALVLIPRRRTFFTDWGAATMYIYLLHTFVLYWGRESGWLRQFAPEWWATPAAIVAGLAITVLLSTRVVRVLTGWLVEPKVPWLLRD